MARYPKNRVGAAAVILSLVGASFALLSTTARAQAVAAAVGAAPIAPPSDEDETEAPVAEEKPKAAREAGTLFERMSSIARGAAQAQVGSDDEAPAYRREPIDIPRFLNRQNNQ